MEFQCDSVPPDSDVIRHAVATEIGNEDTVCIVTIKDLHIVMYARPRATHLQLEMSEMQVDILQ